MPEEAQELEKDTSTDSQSEKNLKSKKDVKQDSSPDNDLVAEWNKLSGPSQDRFRKIIEERNAALKNQSFQQKEEVQSNFNQPVNQPLTYQNNPYDSDEVRKAKQVLMQGEDGFLTKAEFDKALAEKVNEIRVQNQVEGLHNRLEDRYDGTDGLPKYDRVEVEEYVRQSALEGRPIYDREAAFKQMYWDEFIDNASKKKMRTQTETTSSSERPTAKVGQETLTLESWRAKMRDDPKYREKMLNNPHLMDQIIKELTVATE